MKATLEKIYGLAIENIAKTKQGNLSEVYEIQTDQTTYIARIVHSTFELENYLEVNRVDRAKIAPAIIPTLSGKEYQCLSEKNTCVLLQEYLTGGKVATNNLAELRLIAQSVAVLSSELQTGNFHAIPDKFDLLEVYEGLSRQNPEAIVLLDRSGYNAEFFQRLTQLTADQTEMIHADLGIWNMIRQPTAIRIIDFGELRYGSVLFDYAAAFMSALDVNYLSAEQINEYMTVYLHSLANDTLDRVRFCHYCLLWMLRGMLAFTLNYPEAASEAVIVEMLQQAEHFRRAVFI